MKLFEVLDRPLLLENLGNLAQLKMPKLINMLKQGHIDRGAQNKFASEGRAGWFRIGHDSEIRDIENVKSISDIRKAFKDTDALAFALYVDGKPIAFVKTSDYNLAGPSRESSIAFDLSPFKEEIRRREDEAHEKSLDGRSTYQQECMKRDGPTRMDITTFGLDNDDHYVSYDSTVKNRFGDDKEETLKAILQAIKDDDVRRAVSLRSILMKKNIHWPELDTIDKSIKSIKKKSDPNEKVPIKKKYGVNKNTGGLKEFIEFAKTLGKLSAKIVLPTKDAHLKTRARLESKPKFVADFKKDLDSRLKAYKNSKKPTVESVKEFIETVEKGTKGINAIQFDGRTYSVVKTGDGYVKMNGVSLLAGTPFKISYKSVDEGAYDGLDVTYAYIAETGRLEMIEASWRSKENKTKTEILNNLAWLKHQRMSPENKDATLKALLVIVKTANKYQMGLVKTAIDLLKKEGVDWPELDQVLSAAEKIEKDPA